MNERTARSVDEYIAGFPPEIGAVLQKLRQVVRDAAPGARETISYGMPAFKLKRILVYFAAFKDHIGFYPTSSGIEAFKEELKPYRTAKGTVRFPLDRPIPFPLASQSVRASRCETTRPWPWTRS